MLKFILLFVIISLFFKSTEAMNMKQVSYLDKLQDPETKQIVNKMQEEYIAKMVALF